MNRPLGRARYAVATAPHDEGMIHPMRIGIVSDIHGNIAGLDMALDRMGPVDELWCPGDAFDQYRFSNEVVGRLRELDARYILGNHEDVLLSPAGVGAQDRDYVDQELLAWVRDRPHYIEATVNDRSILMFHSTPWEPYGDYLYPHSSDLDRLGDLPVDIAIYGHTHSQLARRVNGTLVINPGSAGLGQDPRNGRRLSYAVLDTQTTEVVFDDFDNPAKPAMPSRAKV